MIRSMTAFARQTRQFEWGSAAWELRSVNHRYLEISLRLPEALNYLEPLVRERLKSCLQRGKIDVNLHCDLTSVGNDRLWINTELLSQLLYHYEQVKSLVQSEGVLDPMALLHWPGMLQPMVVCLEERSAEFLEPLSAALEQLIAMRSNAGLEIYPLLTKRLQGLQLQLDHIKQQLPDLARQPRKRLMMRLEEAKLSLDPTRLEQEMLLYTQKMDVSEEIDRLGLHLAEFEKVLHYGQPVGRRLDFLLQELNREANTLAAKSTHINMTLSAVELKVLIEEIREQVQNIE